MRNHIKTYIIIAILSSLVGIPLNLIWYFAGGEIMIRTVLYYMTVGFVFGTVTFVTLSFAILRFKKARYVFLINFMVDGFLMVLLCYYQNKDCSQGLERDQLIRWILIGIASEVISTLLTACWYYRMRLYNRKLEEKKRSLDMID